MDGWLSAHTFIGKDGCLAAREGQHIAVGDRVAVFESGRPVQVHLIEFTLDGGSTHALFDSLGFHTVVDDTTLWNRVGCAWGLATGNTPYAHTLAHFAPPPTVVDEGEAGLPLGITDLPPGALTIGGDAQALSRAAATALLAGLAGTVPAEFLRATALRHARSFRGAGGSEIVELCLGIPMRQRPHAGATIRSVRILRLYLLKGHALASESLSRTSGEAEHVDLEPPRLNDNNWWEVSEQPIGFVSRNGGITWDRITLDVGFEGIAWRIAWLGPDMPSRWDGYLYTEH